MQSGADNRRRRRRYGPMGPWWAPWVDIRFRSPPDVLYPGYSPWDPFTPPMARKKEDEVQLLERELELLEDEKIEVERDIEDVKKEIERRKRVNREQSDVQ